MFLSLLVANVLHGLVALAWLVGVRRLAGLDHPQVQARLLGAALALPAVLALVRLGRASPADATSPLVRVDLWTSALRAASPTLQAAVALLVGGTALAWLLQEVVPAWLRRGRRLRAPRRKDERLEASLRRTLPLFAGHRLFRGMRRPEAWLLETDLLLAAATGFTRPAVHVSRGFLARLDDRELDLVMAHELAHAARGGTWPMMFAWILRSVQAGSPGALVLFRSLVEENEKACDALAARLTGRPATLASALLDQQGNGLGPAGRGPVGRALRELARRSDRAAARHRVRALLDGAPHAPPPPVLTWLAVAVLGALLWTIG